MRKKQVNDLQPARLRLKCQKADLPSKSLTGIDADRKAVIGLICVCIQERLAAVTFSRDYRQIRRDPDTDEEVDAIFGQKIIAPKFRK